LQDLFTTDADILLDVETNLLRGYSSQRINPPANRVLSALFYELNKADA